MIGSIIAGAVGILFIWLGALIRKKERIDLFHAYHIEQIAPEDRQAFCKVSGIGVLVIGISLVLTAVLFGITDSARSFLVFTAGSAAGLILLISAGIRYRRHG